MDGDQSAARTDSFVVGGVRLPRPFRIRRLGHCGVNVSDIEAGRDFYQRLLGFRTSDQLDFGPRLPPDVRAKVGSTAGYFMRHGTDHHSFVLFPRATMTAVAGGKGNPEVTTNQFTWQVGSLQEVVDGIEWFKKRGVRISRAGRDTPGSNWHVYPYDPDGHLNELYYGIEQIGWDGVSKPLAMHEIRYVEPPALPHRSELAEVKAGVAKGIDVRTGWQQDEVAEEKYNVGGVLLGRPFKIVRIGPVRAFVTDVAQAVAFYRDELGFTVTEEVIWNGHRCVFLRVNTEHHSLALYPMALRTELGLSPHTTLMAFGFQLGSYQQLRDAVPFLKQNGVAVKHLPPELFPGVDYNAFVIDPEGHAMQLYYYMEQVGWDGKPRPASQRPKIDNGNWPETVPAQSDTYGGETYLGPWG